MKTHRTSKEHHRAQALLDSLPAGSTVVDGNGHAWQEGNTPGVRLWHRAYGGRPLTSYGLAFRSPITPLRPK